MNLHDYEGKYFEAQIEDVECIGRITIDKWNGASDCIFLCQNHKDGSHPRNGDLKGYKFSWVVTYNDIERLLKKGEVNSIVNFKIIPNPNKASNEDLLAEAKRRYPKGTRFRPVHMDNGINEVVGDWIVDSEEDSIYVSYKTIEKDWSGCIYFKGKWAEIISTPEQATDKKYDFKEGDEVYFDDDNVFYGYLEVRGKLLPYTKYNLKKSGYDNRYRLKVGPCGGGFYWWVNMDHIKPWSEYASQKQDEFTPIGVKVAYKEYQERESLQIKKVYVPGLDTINFNNNSHLNQKQNEQQVNKIKQGNETSKKKVHEKNSVRGIRKTGKQSSKVCRTKKTISRN